MTELNNFMIRTIEEHKLMFIATTNNDGTPNLSPKGTTLVLDNKNILFGEIRSPQTIANIEQRPTVEINVVNQFTRKGFRASCIGSIHKRNSKRYQNQIPKFNQWSSLKERIENIVQLEVVEAQIICSPAYDDGLSTSQLRAEWVNYFQNMNNLEESL